MAGDTPQRPVTGAPVRPSTTHKNWILYAKPASSARVLAASALVALAFAAAATVMAAAALIVSLNHSSSGSPLVSTTAPTYTAADTAAAHRQLCDTYKLVARAVEVDTGGNDRALARIADTNGAILLDMAATNGAINLNHREAAHALAMAYATVTAMGNSAVASDAEYRAAVDDVIVKNAAMKMVCSGR